MITFHFHLQPQYKYELFHINLNKFVIISVIFIATVVIVVINIVTVTASLHLTAVVILKECCRNAGVKMFLESLNMFIIKFGYNARCHWLEERAL